MYLTCHWSNPNSLIIWIPQHLTDSVRIPTCCYHSCPRLLMWSQIIPYIWNCSRLVCHSSDFCLLRAPQQLCFSLLCVNPHGGKSTSIFYCKNNPLPDKILPPWVNMFYLSRILIWSIWVVRSGEGGGANVAEFENIQVTFNYFKMMKYFDKLSD